MALVDIEASFWSLRRQMEALVGQRLAGTVLQQAGANGGASFARAFVGETEVNHGAQALRDLVSSYQAAGFGQFQIESLEWPLGRALISGTDSVEAWMTCRHGQKPDSPVCAYTAGVLVGFINVLGKRQDIVCVERSCQAQGAENCLFELLPAEVAGDVPAVAFAPDPALGRQLNLLEILFDRMPMGIAIFDKDFRVRRFNPTWVGYINDYSPSSASQVVPGVYFFDLVPGVEPAWISIFERVLAGETVREGALRAETGGFISYWDVVFTPLIEDGVVVGIMDVTTNVTERKLAEEQLREREEQYRGIFESTTDALLIFDREGTIVEANPAACTMLGYAYPELIGLSRENIMHPDYYHFFEDFKKQAESGGRFHAQVVNLRKDKSTLDAEVHGAAFRYKGKPHVLAVVRDVTERMRAYQTLEQEVGKRTRELHTLLDVTAAASSSLALDEMLSAALDRLVLLVGASRAGVLLRDESYAGLMLRMLRPHHNMGQGDQARLIRLSLDVVASGKPLYTNDPEPLALMPLRSRGQALGVLSIVGTGDCTFSSQQAALFEAIADQLGVAIENARLYEQAEQAAALEERQRLARELHDSVTQSLYSVTLFAEAGRRLASAGDLEHVQEYLDRLGETAQEALKELRLLVYELRPWALEREGLVGALQQRLDAVEKRSSVEARLLVEGTIELPAPMEEGLYRIAQEALNNALKHAGATAVTVRIRADAQRVELEVADNGKGFDTDGRMSDRGGVGLISMHERAERLGGSLTVNSRPGEGTNVKIIVETHRNESELV